MATLREVSGVDRVTFGDRQLPIAPDLDDSRLEARFGPAPPDHRWPTGSPRPTGASSELQAQGQLDLSDLEL